MTFQELNLIEPLKRAVAEKGYTTPTPIQQQAIPPALEGRDLMGCAQTGTGKTAAFTLPILQLLAAEPRTKGRRTIKALVLTPTREQAIQIDECCRDYARYTDIRHCVIFGGVNQRPQVDAQQGGIDLLVATPGRLLDLIGQGYVSLADIRFFVLDEADRMLDMGFIHDIRRILPLLPRERQTLFFSATMPDDIVKLANTMLRNPAHVTVTPPASVVETIRQSVLFAEKAEKRTLLASLLRERPESSVLVFSRTKHGADRIARILTKAGIEGRAIHGDKSQGARERAMNDFRSGACRVLIATDIAARGIDISELPLVINYDLPEVPETYVHRIGRTGRAGRDGQAIAFCSEEERPPLEDNPKPTSVILSPFRVCGRCVLPVRFLPAPVTVAAACRACRGVLVLRLLPVRGLLAAGSLPLRFRIAGSLSLRLAPARPLSGLTLCGLFLCGSLFLRLLLPAQTRNGDRMTENPEVRNPPGTNGKREAPRHPEKRRRRREKVRHGQLAVRHPQAGPQITTGQRARQPHHHLEMPERRSGISHFCTSRPTTLSRPAIRKRPRHKPAPASADATATGRQNREIRPGSEKP